MKAIAEKGLTAGCRFNRGHFCREGVYLTCDLGEGALEGERNVLFKVLFSPGEYSN